MKQLPPEIIDGIVYVLTAGFGWLIRWIQGKAKLQNMKRENNALLNYINQRKNFDKR